MISVSWLWLRYVFFKKMSGCLLPGVSLQFYGYWTSIMVSWIFFSTLSGSRWLFEDGWEVAKTMSVGIGTIMVRIFKTQVLAER